jgi:hypothetical protein
VIEIEVNGRGVVPLRSEPDRTDAVQSGGQRTDARFGKRPYSRPSYNNQSGSRALGFKSRRAHPAAHARASVQAIRACRCSAQINKVWDLDCTLRPR